MNSRRSISTENTRDWWSASRTKVGLKLIRYFVHRGNPKTFPRWVSFSCIYNLQILQLLIVGWPRPVRSHFETITGYSFNSNYLYADMPEEYGSYIKFIQSDHVRRSIHVGNRDFGKMRDKVYMYLADDFAQSVRPLVEELLDEDYKLLLYASQLDVIVPHTGISKFIGSLKWKHSKEYLKQARSLWRVQGEIAGYAKSSHNLTHLLVRNAGHSAAIDQGERCLDMITRFTRNLSFWEL